MIFQIAVALLSLVAIVSVIKKRKQDFLGPLGAFVWIVFWVMSAVIIASPDITQKFADSIGIGRGVDLVMYVALAILFFAVFRLYISFERMKRDMTKIVRLHTLHEVEKEVLSKKESSSKS